ncbi:acyl-CoA carboxylase epsilon subunit [Streptomyces sp. NPDC005480]|uniref:acyl-CoA carboxylase epsilon subunit n=1 Tax=Streptomyces sp. NPDC005480 TaxID=3154880 RepID=UPI0033B5E324
MSRSEAVLRVERGRADDAELAALTAVLLALHRAREKPDGELEAVVASSWWRGPEGFVPPGSWR